MNDPLKKASEWTPMHSFHDQIVTMQAAWIEWRRGRGAEAAMEWIHNALEGPGNIPGEGEPWANEAQAYYDANRAIPNPFCACGRPSHIGWMGQWFCSQEHYEAAKASAVSK